MFLRLWGLSLLAVIILCSGKASGQTQEEIDHVTRILGRPQTRSSTCSYLAGIQEGLQHYEKAIEYYKKMLQIYGSDPALGTKSAKYAWCLTKIAFCEKARGNQNVAESLCNQALEITKGRTADNENYDADYLKGIAKYSSIVFGRTIRLSAPSIPTAVNLVSGLPVSEVNNLAEKEVGAIGRVAAARAHGPRDMRLLRELLYLANVYTLEGKYKQAESTFKEVIAAAEGQFGKNSGMLMKPLSNYGYMLQLQGRTKEAEETLQRMKAINQNPSTTFPDKASGVTGI